MCGRFTWGYQYAAGRHCARCDVGWYVLLPEVAPAVSHSQRSLESALGPKWMLRPSQPYADMFDRIIDHGAVSVPAPA